VRHVAIFRDDLEPLNGFCVADNIVKVDGAVFLDPVKAERQTLKIVEWARRINDNREGLKKGSRSCGEVTREARRSCRRHWCWL